MTQALSTKVARNWHALAMVLKGHKEDILDIAWSQGTLLLFSTVKLWRADEHDALQEYPHPDMVTSVSFHPSDTKKFVSGCVDGRDIITAVSFVYDGQQVAAGTMRGKMLELSISSTTNTNIFTTTATINN
eukprot:gene14233-20205_t